MSLKLVISFLVFAIISVDANEYGICSFYAEDYQGKPTASGELFDLNKMTAAHKSLPFNSMIRVKNHKNGKSITIRVNDRGPFVSGRIIDLSKAAFAMVEPTDSGLFPCSYTMENGADTSKLSYSLNLCKNSNLTSFLQPSDHLQQNLSSEVRPVLHPELSDILIHARGSTDAFVILCQVN